MEDVMSLSTRHPHFLVLGCMLLSSASLITTVVSQRDGDLRLSGYGASRLAGRLEIYLSNKWGTLCANGSELVAKVACRQLRLGHFISHLGTPSLRYGLGNESILLEHISCHDEHLHLLRCDHSRVGVNSTCDHHLDISVMCSGVVTPYEGEVRLVGGAFSSDGIAELYLHRKWARICSTGMEPRLADTICRQLGYTGQQSFQPLDNTTGPFWQLSSSSFSSHCSNTSQPCTKSCLPDLSSSHYLTSCTGDMTAWQVTCEAMVSQFSNMTSGSAELCALNNSEPERGQVRLRGDHPDQGRVEVYINGSEWATLQMLGTEEATVVCKQLGFPTYLFFYPLSERPDIILPPFHGPQYSIDCNGLETHINNCTFYTPRFPFQDDAAYIQCSPIRWPFGSLQLIGGAGPFGQLQVSPDDSFHWLCDAHFTMKEASVACRQMGYNRAIRIVKNSLLSDPSSASHLTYSLTCSGHEEYLMACRRQSVVEEVCREEDAVAVQCGSSGATDGWSVRLISATNDSYHDNYSDGVRMGRVEVLLEEGGTWGTVCAHEFSDLSAHVICRQLGFETFSDVIFNDITDHTTSVLLSSVQCTGFEELLDYCPHSLATSNCSTVITVNCSTVIPYPDGSLRLQNSSSLTHPQDGRLEISYHGLWMSVCGRLFTQEAADVACKQLGFEPAANYCQNACSGAGTNWIHFGEYSCRGNETGLLQCGVSIHRNELCNHDYDVGLSCSPSSIVPVIESSSLSLSSSPSSNPTLPSLTSSHTGSTTSQPSVPSPNPTQPLTPTESNKFNPDGIFYVVAFVVFILLLALIVSITICCVCQKKKGIFEFQAQNGSYSDRNDEAINAGANGEIREVAEGDEQSEFDFDAVADDVEMKACAKAVEAMELPPDQASVSSVPPPQYHELEFLSHSIPGEEVKTSLAS